MIKHCEIEVDGQTFEIEDGEMEVEISCCCGCQNATYINIEKLLKAIEEKASGQ
jgi:hypothetical protein